MFYINIIYVLLFMCVQRACTRLLSVRIFWFCYTKIEQYLGNNVILTYNTHTYIHIYIDIQKAKMKCKQVNKWCLLCIEFRIPFKWIKTIQFYLRRRLPYHRSLLFLRQNLKLNLKVDH